MPLFKKKVLREHKLVVTDARPLKADDVEDDESFVYCPGIDSDRIDNFKKTFKRKTDDQYRVEKKFDMTFERKHVKDLIHAITSEIKRKGTKTPLLILPFRPTQNDEDLKKFIDEIFPNGSLIPVEEKHALPIIRKTHELILMSALKFIWCRLPGKAIIGWKSYTSFVKLEDNAGFSDKAFLEFMPSCLSSSAHASIVYDFFDLIVALILNSKENLMTAKKLSRVCGLWAFSPIRKKDYNTPSFERGLYEWIPAGDAVYHLLLAFVKAMPDNGDITKLPKLFQVLLKTSEYPPVPTAVAMETMRNLQEIPVVTIRSNTPSKNPAELLNRVSKTLKFEDATLYYTREDYLLLKRLFKERDQISSKLSVEGSRLLENLCIFDKDLISEGKDLKYKLVPGWSLDMTSRIPSQVTKNTEDLFTAAVGRVTMDDYFMWAWLASLGVEETDFKKKTFGKTYMMEVELAEGFKKWVIVEEQDLARDGYDVELEIKREKLKKIEKEIKLAEIESNKIKLENKLQAQKMEMQRAKEKIREKALQIKDTNKMTELDDSIPAPPLPEKDYSTGKSGLVKPRRPLAKGKMLSPIIDDDGDAEEENPYSQPPPRSAKRRTNSFQNDGGLLNPSENIMESTDFNVPVQISLPDFDNDNDDGPFLKYETLAIHDSDLESNPSPRKHNSKIDMLEEHNFHMKDMAGLTSPVKAGGYVFQNSPDETLGDRTISESTSKGYDSLLANGGTSQPVTTQTSPRIPIRSPHRLSPNHSPQLSPQNSSPNSKVFARPIASPSPENSAASQGMSSRNSPLRSASPQRGYLQYGNASPIPPSSPRNLAYHNSPPRTQYYQMSPTRQVPFHNSPPRTSSPPRSVSPVGQKYQHSPSKTKHPAGFQSSPKQYVNFPAKEAAGGAEVASPSRRNASTYSPEHLSQHNSPVSSPLQKQQNPAPQETVSKDTLEREFEESVSDFSKEQTFVAGRIQNLENKEVEVASIPDLSMPLQEVTKIPILSPPGSPVKPEKSPKMVIREGFDNLENELRDCMIQLDNQPSDPHISQDPEEHDGELLDSVSSSTISRARRPPPPVNEVDVLQSSGFSESSSVYPPSNGHLSERSKDFTTSSEAYVSTNMNAPVKLQQHFIQQKQEMIPRAVPKLDDNQEPLGVSSQQKQLQAHVNKPQHISTAPQQVSSPLPATQQQTHHSHPKSQYVSPPTAYQQHSFQPPAQPYAGKSTHKLPKQQPMQRVQPMQQVRPMQPMQQMPMPMPMQQMPMPMQSYPPYSQHIPAGYISPGAAPMPSKSAYMPPPHMGHSGPPVNGYYPQPQSQLPMGSSPKINRPPATYAENIINHMPPSARVDKLHGPQAMNKKSARDAFMSKDFGI